MNASSGHAALGRIAPRLGATLLAVAFVAAAGVTEGQPMPTTTETSGTSEFEPFVGAYRAVDLDEQAAVIDQAVTEGTEKMGPVRRRVGRKRLHAVNVPVRVLRIDDQGDTLVTDYDGKRYGAPKSGEARRERDPEGKPVNVSYRVVGRTLRARYVGPDGEKIMQFQLGGQDRLTMHVTLLSDQLPEPIRYRLEFRRE